MIQQMIDHINGGFLNRRRALYAEHTAPHVFDIKDAFNKPVAIFKITDNRLTVDFGGVVNVFDTTETEPKAAYVQLLSTGVLLTCMHLSRQEVERWGAAPN